MISRYQARLSALFVASDVLAITATFIYSFAFRFHSYFIPVDPAKGIPTWASYLVALPIFIAIHLGIFFLQGFYKSRLRRTKIDDFFSITINAALAILAVILLSSYFNAYASGTAPLFRLNIVKFSHLFLAVYFVGVILTISFLRNQIYFLMKRRFARGLNLRNVLVVGAGEMGVAVAQKLFQYKDLGFVVKGFLDNRRTPGMMLPVNGGVPVFGPVSELGRIVETQGIHEVYVALELKNYPEILEALQVVNKYPVNVRLIPDLFQLLTLKANVQDLDGFPVISIDEVPLRGARRVLKRSFDLAASGLGLVALSPFFLIFAVIVKATSRGPVFYHQERIGMDGKRFNIHKFRTMVTDAEVKTGPVMCTPDDPRITAVGRFLRKYSIDEWPQLVNIFRGDMSLVGPRPERPEFVKEFTDRIPKYMLRHKMKSGLTGWAQVHGLRQGTSIEKRLEHDFYYIQNWSFALDLKIIWMTLRRGFIDKSMG
ncbi:MAG: undecaprenyl-phosphate glucose phosphotransferase [Candidatus Aminicenantes bacterium]|nr:undecaprenyl-phosphate glucose phosphotransferase [Candidatus Aminicenantes bacterium]